MPGIEAIETVEAEDSQVLGHSEGLFDVDERPEQTTEPGGHVRGELGLEIAQRDVPAVRQDAALLVLLC